MVTRSRSDAQPMWTCDAHATPSPYADMSMIGRRDMSVIATPPEDRTPWQTYVLENSDTLHCDHPQGALGGVQC